MFEMLPNRWQTLAMEANDAPSDPVYSRSREWKGDVAGGVKGRGASGNEGRCFMALGRWLSLKISKRCV